MKFLAAYIMRGRLSAMTVASSLALLSLMFPPVSIVSSASVALVTLRRGAQEGLYVLLISCLAAAGLGSLLLGSYVFALIYGLVLWLPVWLIAIVLREGRQLSVAVEIAVLIGLLGVIGFYLYYPEPTALWNTVLNEMAKPVMQGSAVIPADEMKLSILRVARVMTGIIAAGSVFGLLFGLFLARWWQAALYNPGGFRTEFLTMRTHPQLGYVALMVLAVALTAPGIWAEVSWNIVVLMFVLYAVVGTSALHASFATMKNSRFMVPFLYVTLILIPHVAIAVALFGLGDSLLNLRNKFSNNSGIR